MACSYWHWGQNDDVFNGNVGGTCSRILVSNSPYNVDPQAIICHNILLQMLHLEAGDTLELRMANGQVISQITLNIELAGLGFDLV